MTTSREEDGQDDVAKTTAHDDRAARDDHRAVLIVDDDTEWLADLQNWLDREGIRALGISRGEWVVEAVDFHEPAAVVLDIRLPGADGLDILGQLRRRRPDIPVIVMTAFGGLEMENRARMLGAAAYFDKPFRVRDLVRALRPLRALR